MGASFTRLLKDHKILPVILTSLSIVFILGTVALVQQQNRNFALSSRANARGDEAQNKFKEYWLTHYRDENQICGSSLDINVVDVGDAEDVETNLRCKSPLVCKGDDYTLHTVSVNVQDYGSITADLIGSFGTCERPPSPTPDPSDYGSRGKFCKPTGDCNSGLVCQSVNRVFYCVLNNKSIVNDEICYANSECRSGNCVQSGFGGGFCKPLSTTSPAPESKDNNNDSGGSGGGNPPAPVCPAIAAPGVGITADHYAARNGALEWKAVAGAVKYLLRVEDPADSTVHTDVCGKPAGNDLKGDECVDVVGTKHGYVFQAGRAVRWWVHAVNSCGNVSVSTPQQILRIACGLANEPCCDTSRTSDKCDTTKKLVCSAGKCITSGSTTQPTATPTPTTSPTSSQKGDINLTLKLKFQGVVSKPNSADPIEVKVIIDTGKTASHKVQFTPDENGVWTGTTTYSNVILGSGYSVFVKGPKHLQKKICTVTPSDKDIPGSYSCDDPTITLKAGENSLDFSGIYLLVGDLPNQDGVVTAYDTSYIRQHLSSKDPKVLAIADLNYDGIVDTQDLSLVIQALNVKYDEAVK